MAELQLLAWLWSVAVCVKYNGGTFNVYSFFNTNNKQPLNMLPWMGGIFIISVGVVAPLALLVWKFVIKGNPEVSVRRAD